MYMHQYFQFNFYLNLYILFLGNFLFLMQFKIWMIIIWNFIKYLFIIIFYLKLKYHKIII